MKPLQTATCKLQTASASFILHLALCILTFALARPASAQSYFNSRGLGEIAPAGDARIAALGEPFALSTLNPGIFVNLNQASFSLSGLVAATIGTQGENTRVLRDVRPATFNIATPLPFGTRLFGGINHKFGQDFDVWSDSLADTAYRRHITGRGGIYALRAGLAKSLFDKVGIGVEYNYVIGGSREDWRFEIPNGGYTSTDTIEVDYAGNTLKVGASYQSRLFSLAAYYEPQLGLRVQRLKRVHGVIADSTRTYRLSLPQSYSFAAAVNPVSRFGLNLGLTLNPWSGATLARNDSVLALGYKNVWRGSFGAEYDIDSLHPVRVGYSRQTWYYDASSYPDPGWSPVLPITENGIHLGTSVPIPKFGSLDISGELFLRNSSVMSEAAGRLTLTLAYSEAWMKRTRRWGY